MTIFQRGSTIKMRVITVAGMLAVVFALMVFLVLPAGCASSDAGNVEDAQITDGSNSSGFVAEDTSTVTVDITE